MRDRILKLILLFLPTIINSAVYTYVFGFNPFPPIDDPAIWLKRAYALLGNTYPLWNETTLQYPPFFNIVLALFILLTGNPLFSINFLGILLVSTLPLSIYPLAKYVTGSEYAGVLSVWLLAFHPIFAEMYGWGGYPNLMSQAFLLLTLYYMLKLMDYGRSRDLILSASFSALAVLTHHLTTIVYASIASAFLAQIAYEYLWEKRLGRGSIKAIVPIFVASVAFLAWRAIAGPFQYITYNYASLATRPFDSEAFWWMFKDQFAAGLIFVSAIIGSITLYFYGKKKYLFILSIATIFPFAFTQSYLFGLALDFKRFPSFAVPAIITLSSSALIPLKENWLKLKGKVASFDVEKAFLASILALALAANTLVGLGMPYKVNEYYHYLQDYSYGVDEKLDALNWIKDNTPKDSIVVADASLGRWVEGYSQRRTLLELPPYQIFMVDELERYMASNALFHSNVVMLNEYVRVWDDAPYLTQHTPWIGVSNGQDYTNVLYLVDGTVETRFSFAGSNWTESPYRSKVEDMRYLVRDDSFVSASITYLSKSLNVTRVTTLKSGSNSLEIEYIIGPTIDAKLIETEVPIWIPYESTLKSPRYYSGSLHFAVDDVLVELHADGNFTIGRDSRWGQQRILYNFKPSDNVVKAKLTFTFPSSKRSWWNTRLYSTTSDEVIGQYNVSYIILSKYKDDFMRFLEDPRMNVAYENIKLIVFEVVR